MPDPNRPQTRVVRQILNDPDAPAPKLDRIRQISTWRDWIEGQPQHLGLLILMTVGAFAMLNSADDAPRLLGLTAAGWAEISIVLAIFHQVLVAIVFRAQLHLGIMTSAFGTRDMRAWAAIFLPFLVLRPVSLIMVGVADVPGLLGIRVIEWIIGFGLIALAIWAMHSVLVHFTLRRALGGDHFRDEIAALPLVDKGAFAVTPNAMYGIVFLGLWGIAIAFGSWNALVVALFQHAYIWVHMYCTEGPDMDWIYGDRETRVSSTVESSQQD